MKRLNSIFAVLVMGLAALSLAACSEDDLSTNQYKEGVVLNAYGPNPVMRGGTLRFVGSNLDQVSEVNIPGMSMPITSIDVIKAGVPSEIRVSIDNDGPEEGYVTLKTRTGQTLQTASVLTYTEPIVFEKFQPASVMPGERLVITGDYLNLVHSIAFAQNVIVSEQEFTEHTRYTIVLRVPEEAQTGKIQLFDTDLTTLVDPSLEYQIIESEQALEVGTPTVAGIEGRNKAAAQGTVVAKQGETVTISGSYFNVVSAVVFGEGTNTVEVDEFTLGSDGKTLSVTLPAEAPDGPFSLVCKSGVEVPVGILQTVAPTDCVATPSPVKAGADLTINGQDMDVVTAVEFPDANGDYTLTINTNSVNTMQAWVVSVPEQACEGNLQLRMANGKTVAVPFTLVKPVVTGYDNANVSAGATLTIKGTDLDLVKTVNFGASDEVAVQGTAEAIQLTVPMNAQSGAPELHLANGTVVTGPELSIAEALFCYAVVLPNPEEVELKAGNSMTLTVANGDKLTAVEINGTACQWVLTGDGKTQLIIGIPDNAGKASKVRLVSSNGEITYTLDITPNTEVNTVLWTGTADLAGWSWNWQIGDGAQGASNPKMFADMDLQEGDIIRLFATAYNDWWQVQFFDGHWGAQTEIGVATGLNNGNNINSGIYSLEEHGGAIEIPVTATLKEQLTTFNDWGYCWILQGEGVVITKISVTHYNVLEQTLWSGNVDLQNWAINWQFGDGTQSSGESPTLFADAGLKAGQTLRLYGTPKSDWWQVQFFDGHWGALTSVGDTFGNGNNVNSGICDLANGCIEIHVTDEMANLLTTYTDWGYCLILQGENFIVTKITIE